MWRKLVVQAMARQESDVERGSRLGGAAGTTGMREDCDGGGWQAPGCAERGVGEWKFCDLRKAGKVGEAGAADYGDVDGA